MAIANKRDAYREFRKIMGDKDHTDERELFAVMAVGSRRGMMGCKVLFIGARDSVVVDSAVLCRWVLTQKRLPEFVVVAHNHPSNNPLVSPQDIELTKSLKGAFDTLRIKFADHLVIYDDGFTSIEEKERDLFNYFPRLR